MLVIYNSKQQFHPSNMLGDAAISDDNKPAFLDSLSIGLRTGFCVMSFPSLTKHHMY